MPPLSTGIRWEQDGTVTPHREENKMRNCIINTDCLDGLRKIDGESIHCCVTSPPYYGLRDYGVSGQIGLEQTPKEYVDKLVRLFREIRRVLRPEGTLWLNLGDSYCGTGSKGNHRDPKNAEGRNGQSKSVTENIEGYKHKDLLGIPWAAAFALREDGWYLRQDIIWSKPNAMPESVQDRCTRSHEYIFMFSKSKKYFYDIDAIKEPCSMSSIKRYALADSRKANPPVNGEYKLGVGRGVPRGQHADRLVLGGGKQRGHSRRHAGFNDRWDQMSKKEQCSGVRNKRSVWSVATKPYKGAHFATFPPELIRPCILAGCPIGGTVLDPFMGAGTTALVAKQNARNYLGIEINPAYIILANQRISEIKNPLEGLI